jgi:PEGA domain-containing protein
MAVSRDALVRQPVSSAPLQRETPCLELVQPYPVRRNRPVAILKIPRLWPAMPVVRMPATANIHTMRSSAAEGLDAFGSETEAVPQQVVAVPAPAARKVPAGRKAPAANWLPTVAKWTTVVLLSAAAAVGGMFTYQKRFAARVTTGTITLETTPSGLDVALAGKSLGKTPLTTTLAPGEYDLQVGTAPTAKLVKVSIAAGTSVVQRVEFAETAAAAALGGLRVQTEPSRLPVFVDGTAHGVSPVAIDQLQPGEHEVSVRTSTGVVRRAVTIQPHETLSLIVSSTAAPPEPAGVSAGWISVSSPIALQLREGGKVIGVSESDRLMLPAGDHDIEFANDALGFTVRRTVHVTAGKTAATKVDLPTGILNINAQPWAEVWIDGERVGETPIGNLSRRIGTHEVLFRHPDLGERRETVVVAVGKPTRIGVDLRKK